MNPTSSDDILSSHSQRLPVHAIFLSSNTYYSYFYVIDLYAVLPIILKLVFF